MERRKEQMMTLAKELRLRVGQYKAERNAIRRRAQMLRHMAVCERLDIAQELDKGLLVCERMTLEDMLEEVESIEVMAEDAVEMTEENSE